MEYVKHKRVPMKGNTQLSEKWVQGIIASDPSLLGFGEVEVKDIERVQAHGGRLDLLLYDPETTTRYEVELQLGATDESHIIRTVEYWDTERRRYPQYDHVAVIIAEEITARFFNVISLFNGFIPIVAIQMSAIELNESAVTLVFTKVLDRMTLGSDEEDEGEPTDRNYWEQKSSPEMLKLTDRLLSRIRNFDPDVNLKYNKYYIGLAKNGVATNYVALRPQKRKVNADIRIPRSEEMTELIENVGLDVLPYDTRWNTYRPIVSPRVTDEQLDAIEELARRAHDHYHH
jgi:predicted transport protein